MQHLLKGSICSKAVHPHNLLNMISRRDYEVQPAEIRWSLMTNLNKIKIKHTLVSVKFIFKILHAQHNYTLINYNSSEWMRATWMSLLIQMLLTLYLTIQLVLVQNIFIDVFFSSALPSSSLLWSCRCTHHHLTSQYCAYTLHNICFDCHISLCKTCGVSFHFLGFIVCQMICSSVKRK